MKRFLMLVVLVLSMFAVPTAQAAALEVSGTAEFNSKWEHRGWLGTAAVEESGVRLWGSLGDDLFASAGLDYIVREKGGTYWGFGALVDYTPAFEETYSASDTSLVSRPHDNGRHLGDRKHPRQGKVRTVVTDGVATSYYAESFDPAVSMVLGAGMKRGLFAESRTIVYMRGGPEVQERLSVGVRF